MKQHKLTRHGVPPPSAPALADQFPPHSSHNSTTGVVYTAGLNQPVRLPNQPAIHNQQQGMHPQATYQQPPTCYPQNVAHQPFASNYASHTQVFYEATYQVPPQYVVMPPYIHGTMNQVPVEGWKTGLFYCLDDPMNGNFTNALLINLLYFYFHAKKIPNLKRCYL
ncbi:hypothetical protein PTKIN_Ptkin05aG0140200 [Pterospermum kingtungense]